MKAFVLALTLVGFCTVALALERTVIVPKDTKPFTAEKSDIVRLTGKGIAGSRIEIKIEGPAKLETASTIREVIGGRTPIGMTVKEFDVKSTDTGKVTATITVTPPQPDAKPVVTKYVYEVK